MIDDIDHSLEVYQKEVGWISLRFKWEFFEKSLKCLKIMKI